MSINSHPIYYFAHYLDDMAFDLMLYESIGHPSYCCVSYVVRSKHDAERKVKHSPPKR